LCHALIGYGYTLLNPYMIIFWVAVAAQLAALRDASLGGEIPLGLGVVLSTASWVLGLNFLLHRIKRHLSPQWMQRINYAGALCLFAFVVVVGYQLWVKSAF
jgi:threonine/homoserine/homoserine lactone efflux protein